MNNKGFYTWEHFRKGKKIAGGVIPNTVTVEGRNHILATEFRSGTQQASWFFGLVDDSAFGSNPDTDAMASHPGWTEFQHYAETTRPQWSPSAPSAGALTNGTPAVFTINLAGVVHGFFIASNSTKGGTAGFLWSSVPFATGSATVSPGDEIRVSYSYGISA